jgi:hypothetical protein
LPTKYEWVYLCSDPRRLKLTLKLLPPTMDGLWKMNVCYLGHRDPPDHALKLIETMREHAPRDIVARWEVKNLDNAAGFVPKGLRDYWTTKKPRWALASKLMVPHLFSAPFLYTDDDVIIGQDIAPLTDTSFVSGGSFKFFKGLLSRRYLVQQISEALKHNVSMAEYDNAISDAGFFFIKTDRERTDWMSRLAAFAAMPYLEGLDRDSHEFRRLDQRFLTVFALKHGMRRLKGAKERRNFLSPPPKNVRAAISNTYFVHYMSRDYKAPWMDALEALL